MRTLWNRWKKITERVGNFQASVIFSVLYFVLIVPFGFAVSRFRDFLHQQDFPSWSLMEDSVSTLKRLKSQ